MVKVLEKYIVVLLLIFCIPALWALLVPGFYGASDEVHIAWLFEMDRAIRSGQIPPRFVPDLSYGFGYPLFNFVFPLPFYIGELFHLIGLSFVDSVKAVFFISIPLSALAMYLFLRHITDKKLSFLGALLYVFAPYRSVDLYVRGAIGEILSFVFFPLIGLSILKLTEKGTKYSWKFIGLGAVSLAGLVLTHNIAAYMFLPFMAALAIIRAVSQRNFIIWKQLFLSLLLGLLISSYFWVPALLDSGLMKYDTVFNFVDHFPTLKQLFTPYWGYGASVPGPGDGMSFFLGISSILVLLIGVILTIFFWKKYSKEQKTILTWTLMSLIIVFFMMNYRSILVWNKFPLLPYFQFPWRFLMMTTFLIPILVITLEKVKYSRWIVGGLLVLTMAVNSFYFQPQDFLGRSDEYFLNKYIPCTGDCEISPEYKLNQEEYLRLPKDTKIRPNEVIRVLSNDDGLLPSNTKWLNSLDVSAETFEEKEMILRYYKYNFPGWKADIDGKPTEITSGSPFGQINIKIPAGHHQTKIYFTETPFKMVLDLISVVFLGLSIFLIAKPDVKGNEN